MRKLPDRLSALSLALIFLLAQVQLTIGAPAARAATWAAASCNLSDVQAAMASASAGDTVTIPAGTCTWAAQLALTKNISIIGPNSCTQYPCEGHYTTTLTILDNAGNSDAMILMTPSYGTAGCNTTSSLCMRVSGIHITPVTTTTLLFSSIRIAGTCNTTSCPSIRIDNNDLDGFNSSTSLNGTNASWEIRADNVFGVIDHNLFENGGGNTMVNDGFSTYICDPTNGCGSYGDNSWAQADSFGTANNLFLEENTIASTQQSSGTECDDQPDGGCRLVMAFNTDNNVGQNGIMQWHGTESPQRSRGGREGEAYGNVVNALHAVQVTTAWMRSGTAIIFGNQGTQSGSGFFNLVLNFQLARAGFAGFPPWLNGDGTGQWDTNDGVVYYSGTTTTGGSTMTDTNANGGAGWTSNQLIPNGAPYAIHNVTQGWGAIIQSNTQFTVTQVGTGGFGTYNWQVGDQYQILRARVLIDQEGRGQSLLLTGSAANLVSTGLPGPVNNALDPVYEFADLSPATGFGVVGSGPSDLMIANRDYYAMSSLNQAVNTCTGTCPGGTYAPFDGTSGTGYGPIAAKPTTCTTGVAYLATDQGNWNTSGLTFPGRTWSQGVVYFCTATNTWGRTYTPYAFPHPLESAGAQAPPLPPLNLSLTAQ